jgi:hypothetical protein|tara:strand:- start:832 stop:1014 length:183 start_codon:yes stop_codon:yes gene_type:complete
MIDRINTLENEIKTLQRTILQVMPSGEIWEHGDGRLEIIAEITKIIEIKQKEIKNQIMQD